MLLCKGNYQISHPWIGSGSDWMLTSSVAGGCSRDDLLFQYGTDSSVPIRSQQCSRKLERDGREECIHTNISRLMNS